MILGFSSAFALQDTVVTMIMDGEFARNWNFRTASTSLAPPAFWKKSPWLEKTCYLGVYSVSRAHTNLRTPHFPNMADTEQGLQLTRDLNLVVATGKNWSIPAYWGSIVR
ncbi:sodium-dependent noradrenaline transporter [Diaporthe helianthi]|uniref:Sodium-dependent noradrenaline transporter n=1 Tax=Diaporthe helianthi TaxID=158607 RepID=A0A2P5HPD3_DIAHE|nr:sodium-dependent noradrenaline transporter [Diaporthe helianthi]